ncbi:MAG: hypothetical protein WKF96_05170 [Solirubrobacteraceae bacterium]
MAGAGRRGSTARRDFAPVLTAKGFELTHAEPVVGDPAVADLVRISDRFQLY